MEITERIYRDAMAMAILCLCLCMSWLLCLLPVPAQAQEQPDILVLALNDTSTLPANHPAQDRVKQTLERMLTDAGYYVYTSGNTIDCGVINCASLTIDDLISIVRRTDEKIDLVAFFRIRVSVRTATVNSHRVAISGHLVNVKTHRILRRWDGAAREFIDVPDEVSRIPEWQAEHAANHAASVGAVLAVLLADTVRSYEYDVTLSEFHRDIISAFEEALHLAAMDVETVAGAEFGDRRQLLHIVSTRQYRIKTADGDIRFKKRIRDILDSLGAQYGLEEGTDTRDLRYFNTRIPFIDRYFAAALFLLVLLIYAGNRRISYRNERKQRELQDLLKSASSLLREDQVYAAIGKLDEGIHNLRNRKGFVTEAEEFNRLRRDAISQIRPLKGDFEGLGDLVGHLFNTNDEVSISRRSSNNLIPGIAIGFKRLSGLGRQSRLYRESDTVSIKDLDSRNGTSVDGRFLSASEMVPIHKPHKVGLGGNRESQVVGNCLLEVEPAKHSRGSVVAKFGKQAMELLDRSGMGEAWGSIEKDLATRWILMGRLLAVGVCEGRLDVGCLKSETAEFYFHFENGLEVSPVAETTGAVLSIDGVKISSRLPIKSGARLELDGLSFSLKSIGEKLT